MTGRLLPWIGVLLAGLCATSVLSCGSVEPKPDEKPVAGPALAGMRGFHEVVLSVENLPVSEEYFTTVGGYQVRERGPVDPRWLELWNLSAEMTADQVLLANPSASRGYLRLIQFHSEVGAERIRPSGRSWDTGGHFDFNVRVADAKSSFDRSRRMGWLAYSDPVEFSFGVFIVREVLVRGPDDTVIAMIQRVQPDLEPGWHLGRGFSRVFNSTQIVKDYEKTVSFYRDVLGFQTYMEHHGASSVPGPNVLGMPHDIAASHARHIVILSPDGRNEGSIEILAFDDLVGADCSKRAQPPNLGIVALRFPVADLDVLMARLESAKYPYRQTRVRFPGLGEASWVVLQTPEGAILEFFEQEGDQTDESGS